jgi:diguanylate cyclase (GGDEF)-like protein/PAS domain S-box-containing protein
MQSTKERSASILDIATLNVICLEPDDTLGKAAEVMAAKRISSLVVVDGDRHPMGIVTERNILHAMQSGRPPECALIEVMSSPVITVPQDIPLYEAYQLCEYRHIRHLVVVDEAGALKGVVSETDFRRHLNLSALAGRRKILSVARRSVLTLPPDTLLSGALQLMLTQHKTCAVVVQDRKPLGIVTERDVVRLYTGKGQVDGTTLAEVMTSPILTLPGDASTSQAAELMLIHKVRHLVIVDESGHLAGLVTEHELTHSMMAVPKEERSGIEHSFLKTLLDSLPDLVWLKDPNGRFLACNARMEACLGVREHDIIGKTDHDFVASSQAEAFLTQDRLAMTQEGPTTIEEWVTFPCDGRQRLLETIKVPMRDSYGRLIGVLGVARDITARRQSELALQESQTRLAQREELLHTLIETIPDAIQFKDGEGRWLECNTAARSAFGLETEDCLGRSDAELAKLVSRPFRAALQGCHETDEQVWRNGKRSRVEETIPVPGGGRMTFDVIKVPLFNADGSRRGLIIVGRDISELKQASELAMAREKVLRTVTDNSPEIIVRFDRDCRRIFVNAAYERLTGKRSADTLGQTPFESWWIPEDAFGALRFQAHLQHVIDTGKPSEWEMGWQLDEARKGCLLVQAVPEFDAAGNVESVLTFSADITERKRSEDALRINASVFDTSQEAILITDASNDIIDVNPAFTRITGYQRKEVIGKNPRLLSSGQHDSGFYTAMWDTLARNKGWRGEVWNRRKSGEVYAELLSISAIHDKQGQPQRYVGVFSDITHLKDHEAELHRVANHDILTGLPNRRLLADRLDQAIVRAQRNGRMLAVCYLDLDGFKQVNDQFGHEAGDQLLIVIARRLQASLRADDTLARLGGDEFVILFNELASKLECYAILDRMLDAIKQPVTIDIHQAEVSASIGVTFYPEDYEDGDTLLRHADQAMYSAKQSGKNHYQLYEAGRKHHPITAGLHKQILRGLETDQFELYFQPKVDLANGRTSGVEALIRWHHPEEGLLLPGDFLPMIESSSVEVRLGEWVMDNALRQLDEWHRAGLRLDMSINISAHHLQTPDFVTGLAERLARHPGLPRNSLQIEVLETVALSDIEQTTRTINACRELGVTFALDDFGTGYSSLTYLRKLSADVLKIDQSFVINMQEDAGDQAIVQGIVALANAFGRKTVAEGVERPALIHSLRQAGCNGAQGFGIAHPMPVRELLVWMREKEAD